ncbi:MAG: DNA gyrase inhibitor YacG [Pseudobdellovibrionaceae bacterium]|jgi:endogenous inhibitor of DNA gyrase (YacG/DUF329 family)
MSDQSASSQRKVKCPQCGKETVFAPENKFRPFCSERCRLIDLGDWASEAYKIPTREQGSVQDPEAYQRDEEEDT